MASFTVHTPVRAAGEPPSPEKVVFLRDGFSWSALLFGPLWLAWRRAWLAAGACFGAMLLLSIGAAQLGLGSEAPPLISAAICLALGFEGDRLIAWTLARRGYRESAVVCGENEEEAEEVYFHHGREGPTPAPFPAGPWDTIAAREQEGRTA